MATSEVQKISGQGLASSYFITRETVSSLIASVSVAGEHSSVDSRCWRRGLPLIHLNRFKLINHQIHFLPKWSMNNITKNVIFHSQKAHYWIQELHGHSTLTLLLTRKIIFKIIQNPFLRSFYILLSHWGGGSSIWWSSLLHSFPGQHSKDIMYV